MNEKKLIEEAILMPVEKRAMIVDSLLKSLNPIDSNIDKEWINLAKKRLVEIRTGKVQVISGEKVFTDIWKNLST